MRGCAGVTTFPVVEIAPSQDAWRDLPDDVRQQLKVAYPRRQAEPAHAQAAVAWARHRRRAYTATQRAAWAVVVLMALWVLVANWVPALRPAHSQNDVIRIALLVGALALLTGIGFVVAVSTLTRVEAAHLAAALTGADPSLRVASPTLVGWRYPRLLRGASALLIGVLVIAYLWVVWRVAGASLHAGSLLEGLNVVVLVAIAARWAYVWPWPIASSYPVLATIDEHDLRVHPLGLTVPWHRVTRVRFAAGARGAAVYWHVDDPVAVVADAPVSPAQQRRLLRWITANGGAIRLSAAQMRDAPETAYLASERFRTGRSSMYRQPTGS